MKILTKSTSFYKMDIMITIQNPLNELWETDIYWITIFLLFVRKISKNWTAIYTPFKIYKMKNKIPQINKSSHYLLINFVIK